MKLYFLACKLVNDCIRVSEAELRCHGDSVIINDWPNLELVQATFFLTVVSYD